MRFGTSFEISLNPFRSVKAEAVNSSFQHEIQVDLDVSGRILTRLSAAVIATCGFAASLAFLGLSKWFWIGLIAVGALGFSDSISVAIRRTMVQYLAPDQMRGRATSFLTVFAQTTNSLGAVIAGASAALLGAPNAVLMGSFLCAASIAATCCMIPQLWRYQSD